MVLILTRLDCVPVAPYAKQQPAEKKPEPKPEKPPEKPKS